MICGADISQGYIEVPPLILALEPSDKIFVRLLTVLLFNVSLLFNFLVFMVKILLYFSLLNLSSIDLKY